MLKATVLMVYSMVLYVRGDISGSEKKINEAEDIIKQNDVSPYFTYYLVAWKLARLVKLKQYVQANNIIRDYDLAVGNEISHVNETVYMVYARLLLAESKLTEAESVLSKLYAIINQGKRTERMIDLKISYAILYKMQRNHQKAITDLIEAMELAEGENLISVFIFCMDEVGDL